MPERGKCISMGQATFSEAEAADQERYVEVAINSPEKKEQQKEE